VTVGRAASGNARSTLHTANLAAGQWIIDFQATGKVFGGLLTHGRARLDRLERVLQPLALGRGRPRQPLVRPRRRLRLLRGLRRGRRRLRNPGEVDYRIVVGFKARVEARLFGITLAGVWLEAEVEARGTGRTELVARVSVKVKILFVTIRKSASFKLGTVQLPTPVYLAGQVIDSNPSKGTALWDPTRADNDGTLYLNVGSRAVANDKFLRPRRGGDRRRRRLLHRARRRQRRQRQRRDDPGRRHGPARRSTAAAPDHRRRR
jgi:hypothetical protein